MRPGSADPKMHVHMTDNRSSSSASVLVVTVPEAAELGLYVHVPFCAKRCGYCSFNTAPLEDGAMARYLAALHREIDLLGALAWAPRVRLATVFFGGGTPRSEEHTSELQSHHDLVCRLLLEKKKKKKKKKKYNK